jgi:hypothetical protein
VIRDIQHSTKRNALITKTHFSHIKCAHAEIGCSPIFFDKIISPNDAIGVPLSSAFVSCRKQGLGADAIEICLAAT